MPSGPAASTAASQSRSVWSTSSSRWVRQESSLMTAAYCPCPGWHPRWPGAPLPGAVGPRARPAALELPDLGPHVSEVDGGRDEGDDREDRQWVGKVGDTGQADEAGHAEDDQPERLGLLAGRGERGSGPARGVDEGPHLDDQGRQPQCLEEPGERGRNSGGEHPSRLSAPGTIWAESPRPGGRAGAGGAGGMRGAGCGTRGAGPGPGGIEPDGDPPRWPGGQDLLDRWWLWVLGLPLSAPLRGAVLRPLRAFSPRLASLSYSAAARVRAVVAYPLARLDNVLIEASSRHLASQAVSSRSLSEASTPAPAAACTGLLSASLRISVRTSMVRFICVSHSPWPERAGLLGWCAGAFAPELSWSVPSS